MVKSSIIVNCACNVLRSFLVIMLNILTIRALKKTSSLPKTLKTLLLSLVVSDLGVGFLVQPLFVVHLVTKGKNGVKTNTFWTEEAFAFMGVLLSYASFFGVMVLTADRYLAIRLHLRYQELVTHKRVVSVVMSVWVISALCSILDRLEEGITNVIESTIAPVFLILTSFFNCKIYLAVRRHRNQIQDLQVQLEAQNAEGMATATKLRKSAVGTFYLFLAFLVCYLPYICINLVFTIKRSSLIITLKDYTRTLVFLNSSLNPLVYCWTMRQIRLAIRDILRKILPRHEINR